jgi:hypothetical protein
MHIIIEALPLLFGCCIGLIFWFTKTFAYKKVLLGVLTIILGIIANRLNGEGTELLIIDIPLTVVSALATVFSFRFITKIRF